MEQRGQGAVANERTESWEKKNGGQGDELRQRWKSADQAEEVLEAEQKGLPGLRGQSVEQMKGERGVKVGGEMKEVDWTRTAGRGG